jgi:two-component system LytT family response regulator
MIYKYLMIEDNPAAAELLNILMEDYQDFQSSLISCDMKEGIRSILNVKPDLVFLDVELPDFTGFDFIKELRNHLQVLPEIIMMTAHEKYALKAVNEEILYYLVKPIDPDELFKGIHKFRIKKAKAQKAITIKNQKGYSFLNFDDIFLIKSSSNYTFFYTRDLQKVMISKTMKEFEPFLNDQFLRVHKSYIVNIDCIKFLNTTKKKLQLYVPELSELPQNDDSLMHFNDILIEDNNLEIPIGEAFLEKVKNSILYNKIS